MDITGIIAKELSIKIWQVEKTIELIDEGNTIPFISRYRKEVTGSLNDEQLRNLDERLRYLRNLEDRKAQVIESITEQGKLTDELKTLKLQKKNLMKDLSVAEKKEAAAKEEQSMKDLAKLLREKGLSVEDVRNMLDKESK